MPPSIHVTSWETEGITLASPADPDFDSLSRSLFKGNVEELLKLKPFLVVVSNQSPRTIVAYTLRWRVRLLNGKQVTTFSQAKYPDAVAGAVPSRGNEIRSGEQKIAAKGIEIDCGRWSGKPTEEYYLRQFASWADESVGATDIQIGLDSVIFEDGELIGPGESRLGDDFAAYVKAKQDLYWSLVQGLDSGQSMDEAFRPIEATIAATRANPRLDLRDPFAIWPRQAAGELSGWRKRYGDVALPNILRQALRKKPFVIRRRDEPSSS
jgi:hypothetical protein